MEETLSGKVWDFFVRPIEPPDDSCESYTLMIREAGDELGQVGNMHNFLDDRFKRCGITRALIPEVAHYLRRTIRSSVGEKKVEGSERGIGDQRVAKVQESRNQESTWAWEGMVRRGIARYEQDEDRFYFDDP